MCRNRVVKSEKDFASTVKSFSMCNIVLRDVNNVYGFSIEQIKSTFTIFCIVCNYVMIRYHGTLPPNLIVFLVDCILFCHSLPPLLYHDCWRMEENTDLVRKNLTTALNNVGSRHANEKRVGRRIIRTIRPLRVKVGGLYKLDRMMTPTYIFVVINCTVTALLSS